LASKSSGYTSGKDAGEPGQQADEEAECKTLKYDFVKPAVVSSAAKRILNIV
jgi:hypothetical protein